ncbi:hypothetical protein KALB_1903 [Kutzneria albida DSM 43870]|uniref:Amidohydrolase-related domain-containing protein n=1 Tax=Kutzneria albida DSM 43870 TaxID=1449976 RepID=W5W284_9PSEU|nr:hypothetical protein KALB_1903 [Kutzneria albida DSM 43870]
MLLFTSVDVFDSTDLLPGRHVLVRDGVVAKVSTAPIPYRATVIDGTGQTLLPGLIDSHVHLWAATATTESAVFGVTTTLDMFSPPELARQWTTGVPGVGPVADTRTAVFPATAPHGHGTEFGIGTPVLTEPEQARGFVEDQLAHGASYIKIICDAVHGAESSLRPEVVAALVSAAHERGVLAVAHATVAADAAIARVAGADVLMHVPVDEASAVLTDGVLVTTLATLHSGFFAGKRPEVLDDPDLRPLLCPDARENLAQGWRLPDTWRYETAQANVRAARDQGVRILAGTDAGMPGTAHGASLHHELALLVESGLTPTEALRSATSAPAEVFGLADRGRIAPGLRADLLLVHGNPTADVRHTRRIRGVWVAGEPVRHDVWRARLERIESRLSTRPAHPSGPLPTDRWKPLTDGSSRAVLTMRPESLCVDTEVQPSAGWQVCFAGTSYTISDAEDGTNLSDSKEITLTVRADQPCVLAASLDAGYPLKPPVVVPVPVGTEFQRHTLSLSAFGPVDLRTWRDMAVALQEQRNCAGGSLASELAVRAAIQGGSPLTQVRR